MDKLKRFFGVAERVRKGLEVSDDDLSFYFSYAPEINEKAINDYLAADKNASREQAEAAVVEAGRMLQSDPLYKEQILNLATSQKGEKLTNRLAEGINLVLAGTDIANSISQIKAGDNAAKSSRRPTRPLIPQRDMYLQQALRQANEGTMDAGRAIAPVQAEIQDQYLTDIQNAKTASTGQAGAFGAYAQLAADRRKRSAMELAPIQDSIRAREQARYDQLLGMRADETQQMFNNQSQFYNTDVYQYGQDQEAAAALGSVGRQNLRGSLYNLGNQIAPAIGDIYSQRKYDRLKNTAMASGLNPDYVTSINKSLDGYVQPSTSFYKNPELIYEAYNKYNPYQ